MCTLESQYVYINVNVLGCAHLDFQYVYINVNVLGCAHLDHNMFTLT